MISDLISEAKATKDAIDEAYNGVESANEAAHAAPPAPPPAPSEADFFGGWGSDAPPPAPIPAPTENAPPPAPTQKETQHVQDDDDPPSYSYNNAPAPAAPGMFDGGSYDPGHNRNASNMSGFGEVMGTGPGLGALPAVGETASFGGSEIQSSPSMAEVEVLKSKSKEADDVARDAEESKRQLTAQLDELRRLADEAEEKSRGASAKPVVKKKGLLKRGGAQQRKDAVCSRWSSVLKKKCRCIRRISPAVSFSLPDASHRKNSRDSQWMRGIRRRK